MTDKNAIWKWLILLCALASSLVLVSPPKEKINLGIDLAGGTSFTIELDADGVVEDVRLEMPGATDAEVKKAVNERLNGAQDRALEVIRNRIDAIGTKEPIIYPYKDNRIIAQLPEASEAEVAEAERALGKPAFLEFKIVHENTFALTEQLFSEGEAPPGYEIVSRRDNEYLKRADTYESEKAKPGYRVRLSRFKSPDAGHELMLQEEEVDGEKLYIPYYVERIAKVTGANLKNAGVDFSAMMDPVVTLQFDSKGAKRFRQVTADYSPGGDMNPGMNTYRLLAIVLDDTLYSAPRLTEPIPGGRAQVEGGFSPDEAHFLANILKAGALDVPVKIIEKRQVSASLGEDSIRSGVKAVLYGGIGVLVFMMVYYMACGIIADLALVLNLLLLPLGMVIAAGFLGIFATDAVSRGSVQLPVLTLPGIAGILLTIGMAVDANVLIFERIREENASGKKFWTAILAGYERAFVTIVDANTTTLLTGVILFIFGSGPIRGFAVTLCAGIAISMFTALVVTKLFFGVAAKVFKLKSVRMLTIVKKTALDFVGKRKAAGIFSAAVILISWGLLINNGLNNPGKVFGVDFTGGSAMLFKFESEASVEDVRNALETKGVDGAMIQYHRALEAGGTERLQVTVGDELVDGVKPSEVVKNVLVSEFPDNGFSLEQQDEVGGQVGDELTRRAIGAIVISLLGIILYVSWRFEFGFSLGAIAALAHDVLFTVGVYSLFGRQLSLPIVAALLTIVGYSVNDTIVVFDRIREDLKLLRGKTFTEICNISINQTLSRTLLTSITTLITVGMLLAIGGGAINDFALALCIGVIVGTYSSIFVATPVVLLFYKDKSPDFGKPS